EGRAAAPQTTGASAPRESQGAPGRSQEERQAPTRRRTPPPPDLEGRAGGAAPSASDDLDEPRRPHTGPDTDPERHPEQTGLEPFQHFDPFLERVLALVQLLVGG